MILPICQSELIFEGSKGVAVDFGVFSKPTVIPLGCFLGLRKLQLFDQLAKSMLEPIFERTT